MAWNNSVKLTGSVWDRPEMKELKSGAVCSTFSLGVKNKLGKKPDGKPDEKISWLRIKCWGNEAIDAYNNLEKGDTATIIGRLIVRQWEKDGVKRSIVETWVEMKGLSWEKKDGTKGVCYDKKREIEQEREEINLDDEDPF